MTTSPGPTGPGPTSPGPTSPGPTSPGPRSPGPTGSAAPAGSAGRPAADPTGRAAGPARRPPGPAPTLATVTHLLAPGHQLARVPLAGVQGTLALDLERWPSIPATPELRVLPAAAGAVDPALRAWAARFAQATVEVLGGDRPVAQLLRWTTARVYADLDRRVRVLGQVAPAPGRLRTVRPQVRSVHVFRPGPDCAEVSAHVRHGERSRALAARLERREGRWRCVALELG